MSEEKQLQIENLVYRLNMLALERMEKFDELWALENQTTELRNKLVKLMASRAGEL
jgi:hypothetical protein